MFDRLQVAACAAVTIIGIAGCGSVDPEPLPPAPRMIAFTIDPFDERGIRPDPLAGEADVTSSGGILVEWERLTPAQLNGVTLGGYHLYRADSTDALGRPGAFTRLATLAESLVGSDSSYTDTAVTANTRYWYTLRAFTRNGGSEGSWSDTVSYTLTDRPVPISPIGVIEDSSDEPIRFRFGPSTVGGEVVVWLDRVHPENDRIVLDTVWRSREHAPFAVPEVVYDGPPLVSNEHYRWRVDKVFGTQPLGNASRWVSFVAP
jgi:hypothetical protein